MQGDTQGSSAMVASVARMHGRLGDPTWAAPALVTEFDVNARLTFTDIKAHEYMDLPDVMRKKVALLASMIRRSSCLICYTGAGISTAAGIDDYATKAKDASVTATADRPRVKDWKTARPTLAHRVLASLYHSGFLKHWIQQNHDSLPQKAGFPQCCLNEIHGSLHDPSNPVVPFEGEVRPDLETWLKWWRDAADLCLALGTSMSGFDADTAASGVAKAFEEGRNSLGLVIVNLQQTQYDELSSLRIYGRLDDVFGMLAREMELPVLQMDSSYSPDIPSTSCVGEDRFLVPFDREGNPLCCPVDQAWHPVPCNSTPVTTPASATTSTTACSLTTTPSPTSSRIRQVVPLPYTVPTESFTVWNLSIGTQVQLTGGPFEGDVGVITKKSPEGHYCVHITDSLNKVLNIKRRPFSLWLGNWWIEMATKGYGICPGGKLPLIAPKAPPPPSEATCTSPAAPPASATPVDLSRYTTMLKIGLEEAVVHQKMQLDGVPEYLIGNFFHPPPTPPPPPPPQKH
ncbi:NAD-dependent protein deacetylase sirtuin-7 [Pelomyxa schiedti]|nr:NAD-dependent protein deacetylase sirtuin-7 [Pelomyxa schiedti]